MNILSFAYRSVKDATFEDKLIIFKYLTILQIDIKKNNAIIFL